MKQRRGQHRARAALRQRFVKVFQRACSARGDYGNAHRLRYRAREFDIVTAAGAVAIHTRQQDLARTESLRAHGPLERVKTNIAAASVSVHFPTAVRIVRVAPPRIDRDDDTLTAK